MENQIQCPKCGSTQITAAKKGFSGGKALAGAVLTGGVGLLAGTIGSKDIIITCLACGNTWEPGEKGSIKLSNTDKATIDNYIISQLRAGNATLATGHAREKLNIGFMEAVKYVEGLRHKNNIPKKDAPKLNKGVAIFAAVVFGFIAAILLLIAAGDGGGTGLIIAGVINLAIAALFIRSAIKK